eukprot:9044383-Heterocapsa_arctica.AAC.1
MVAKPWLMNCGIGACCCRQRDVESGAGGTAAGDPADAEDIRSYYPLDPAVWGDRARTPADRRWRGL